ncbi:MAG: bifunctional diaminohydroxyphosphoribosylaminopyrimidine deaminase/5-amino-6-(5-phosphoribosylamino)uracil reductase RibD [Bacteroidota bacterium]|nr:bifunctional diaminohydroxyphosphoribosylaminopyrimidine deaminase/5-amino-6-(5-phosphoribosylamino)uracil reductase RibD [Bacteroidota bacterium]
MNSAHEIYIKRCIEIGRLGAGAVAPNPLVGSVIVYKNKIIGEGWHQKFGEAHAEVNAISAVSSTELLQEATLYVNLEPCCHQGKTPPCTDLIIAHKLKRVVVGMTDPNPLVSGKGIERLRAAGIEVITGVLEDACRELNKRFITYILKHRPYIILKWAQTLNGFIAPDATKMSAEQFEKERHITGKVIQKLVHKWRTQEAAIMVGTNTAMFDNPALNAREWIGNLPLRIVLDRGIRLPNHLKVFDKTQATWIVNEVEDRVEENLNYIKVNFKEDWFNQLLNLLYAHKIQSLIIEGGTQLLNHVIKNKKWDEAIVFYASAAITDGIKAPATGGKIIQQLSIDQVKMIQYQKV